MKKSAKKSTVKRAKKNTAKRSKKAAAKKATKTSRRRTITAKRKKSVSHDSSSQKNGTGQKKQITARKKVKAGASEKPGYRDIEKSVRSEMSWDNQERPHEEWREVGVHGGRSEKKGYRTRGRHQSLRKRRRLLLRDEHRERRHPRHEENYFGRRRRRAYLADERRAHRADLMDDYREARSIGENPFGEHERSGGRREYLGGNKRRPGLVGRRHRHRHFEFEDRLGVDREEERLRHRRAVREKNRKTYGVWDPEEVAAQKGIDEVEEFDHMYEDEGYQHGGNTEGFGRREGRQKHHRWTDVDLYREGHATLKNGYGKDDTR